MKNAREERVFNLSMEYAKVILEKWCLIRTLNEEVTENILFEREDVNTYKTYLNKVLSLYIEIYPKVEARSDLFDSDFIERYQSYKTYYDNRKMLLTRGNANKINDIECAVGYALARFGILDFEV